MTTNRTNRAGYISHLIRELLFVSLYRAFAESLASENASRLTAMQSAERNIEDRLWLRSTHRRELVPPESQKRSRACLTALRYTSELILAAFEPPG